MNNIKLVIRAFALIICTVNSGIISGQVNGDYQTRAGGNWNSNATWQVRSGGAWVNCALGDYPGATAGAGTVTVVNNVTFNVSPANSIGSLIIGANLTPDNSDRSLTVTGNVSISSGTISLSANNSRELTLTIGGNFSMTGGTITETANSYGLIIFNKSGTQTFSKTGGTISNDINFTVNSGSDLNLGTNIINGSTGTFTVISGATLTTAHPDGISASGAAGSIQSTGTRSFNSGANYIYNGTVAQITGSGLPSTVNNLTINNPAGVTLTGGVTVSNILTMTLGNINTGSNTLILSNSTTTKLSYTSGTITGKFQRAVGSAGTTYLYPVGTQDVYNPLKISFTNLTAGQLSVQFLPDDIGVAGLPLLNDAGTNIYDRQTTGYWSLTAVNPMASTSYTVNLNYTGFSGVDANARILKSTNGGSLFLNGTHGTVSGSEITRTALSGISAGTTDFAIGKPDPRFTTQPSNVVGCTGSFTVVVSGRPVLTYQWQENSGGGFTNITNGGVYSGATSNTLTLTGASQLMNSFQYRCIVTDGLGYTATSNSATLTTATSTFGYNYSMDITLDPASGTADLTDFPALISFASTLLRSTANGGHTTSASGYDIIFTDLNGSKLDHQIEYYEQTSGEYVAWVRIPVLSNSAPTSIRMYYGNPTVSLNPSVKSVWTSSYKGVWHLNGTDYTDATTYNNNGVNTNTTNIAGRIAGGRGFNGSNAFITTPTNGFVPNDNNQSISIWANYPSIPGGNANLISFQAGQSGSAIQMGFRGGAAVAWEWGGTILADGGAAPSTNTWHYYVYSYDGTISRIYIDGALKGSSSVAPQTLLPTEGNIGRYNSGEYINASIDEARFSMSSKSAGWIQTEYKNQNDPAGFITLGSEVNATLLGSVGFCSTVFTLNQGFPAGGSYSGTGVSGTNFDASQAGVGPHAVTYSYTDINGCTSSASKNIVVTPLPSSPVASNMQCCYLNIVDLEAIGTNLKWYSDAGRTTLVGNGTPFATGRTTAGVYTYYVTQTVNGCESSVTPVSLTILGGITISTNPLATSICTSGSGTFSVVATGYNLSYQWQVNTANISDGGVYSGVTTPTLTITLPGTGLNGGSYRCVVTGPCGTSPEYSSAAVLTVTNDPVATFSYAGTPYCPNSANPSPTLSGVAGAFSSTIGLVFISSATGQINISASTTGTYTVTNTIAAAGGCGIVTATSPITIAEPVWSGTTGTDWNATANWSCGMVPGPNTSVRIANVANQPVLNAGAVGSVRNITIDPSSSLTISGNTLNVSGVITNNGTITASSGTIEFNGSSPQTISANTFSGNIVRNLTINNPAGVILGGSLNITGIVTAQSGVFSANDYLTLISDATATALISGSGTGSVTGNVTMQRYLPSGFGYKYFSSPFQAATVSQFSDDLALGPFTFFRFNENSSSSGWINYHTPVSNPLSPMQGYAVNFGSDPAPKTVDVTGEVNNGNLSVNILNHDSVYTDGFNLVGNPYPSPINWNAAGWTKTNLDNALYYFKASTTDEYGGRYGSYAGGFSNDGDSSSNIIPSMQGFFVRVSDGTYPVTGTLGMTNSVRVTDMTHPFLKSVQMVSTPFIRLTANFSDDNESTDYTVIYFDEEATSGFDSQFDALKLYNTDYNIANFYSLGSDEKKLSISAMPLITDNLCTIPLGLYLNRTGNIIFKVKDLDESLSGMRVYLSDASTGSVQDLGNGNQYQINLGYGEYSNRFFLNLNNLTTEIPSGSPPSELFSIYSTHGVLKTEINIKNGEKGILYIYNLTGQILFSNKINDPGYHEFSPGFKDGIYIVSFVSDNRISSKKIIIQN